MRRIVSGGLAGVDARIASGPATISELWSVIDFTDDPSGFSGEIPGSNRWPLATSLGQSGTGAPANTDFAARIPGTIDISVADVYRFRTYNDDGVRLRVGGVTVIHVQNIKDPPLASAAQPTVASLWPPNHQMVAVGITGVTDSNSNATIFITGVPQDEATNGLGDGDTAIDAIINAIINADGTVLLRSERAGNGDGRVYRISFTATDFESSSSGVVLVSVPHSVKKPAIDSLGIFNSTN